MKLFMFSESFPDIHRKYNNKNEYDCILHSDSKVMQPQLHYYFIIVI
jgi:hypothetical protein